MPQIGPLELIVILLIALVVFGPKRLPSLARSVGTGIREAKESVSLADPRDVDAEQGRRPARAPSTSQVTRDSDSGLRSSPGGGLEAD